MHTHEQTHRNQRDLELMLDVERHRRGLPAAPPTAWGQAWSPEPSVPTCCAACGSSDQVQADPRCGGIPFCAECSSRARNLTEWDDLGCGD